MDITSWTLMKYAIQSKVTAQFYHKENWLSTADSQCNNEMNYIKRYIYERQISSSNGTSKVSENVGFV